MSKTLAHVAQSFGITLAQAADLKSAMASAWGTICYDYLECFDGGEDEALEVFGGSEAAMVSEAVLDSGHHAMYGGFPNGHFKWLDQVDAVLGLGEQIWDARL